MITIAQTSNNVSNKDSAVNIKNFCGGVTITKANMPLWVVDGKVKDSGYIKTSLDQNSIESINILKDSKATELYGTLAKNGVVLITTKKRCLYQ